MRANSFNDQGYNVEVSDPVFQPKHQHKRLPASPIIKLTSKDERRRDQEEVEGCCEQTFHWQTLAALRHSAWGPTPYELLDWEQTVAKEPKKT